MGRMITIVAVAGGLMIAWAAPVQATQPKTLLQDLKHQGVSEAAAAVLTTSTCVALAKTGRFEVLCGEDLRAMMRYGTLAASFDSCQGQACFGQLTKALKARYVVSGAVSRLGNTFLLGLSMFDTERARVVGRTEVKARSLESLQQQIAEAVSALLKSPPRRAR